MEFAEESRTMKVSFCQRFPAVVGFAISNSQEYLSNKGKDSDGINLKYYTNKN